VGPIVKDDEYTSLKYVYRGWTVANSFAILSLCHLASAKIWMMSVLFGRAVWVIDRSVFWQMR
jgi:hypothetical protein